MAQFDGVSLVLRMNRRAVRQEVIALIHSKSPRPLAILDSYNVRDECVNQLFAWIGAGDDD